MTTAKAVPGSFRDPSGRVYQVGERIFRTINPSFADDYEFVHSTGLLDRLAEEGRVIPAVSVDHSLLGPAGCSAKYVLECPKLPFVSFPYEWSFPALKAAALLHLDIHLAALERGVTLSDSSTYNVQFYGTTQFSLIICLSSDIGKVRCGQGTDSIASSFWFLSCCGHSLASPIMHGIGAPRKAFWLATSRSCFVGAITLIGMSLLTLPCHLFFRARPRITKLALIKNHCLKWVCHSIHYAEC